MIVGKGVSFFKFLKFLFEPLFPLSLFPKVFNPIDKLLNHTFLIK